MIYFPKKLMTSSLILSHSRCLLLKVLQFLSCTSNSTWRSMDPLKEFYAKKWNQKPNEALYLSLSFTFTTCSKHTSASSLSIFCRFGSSLKTVSSDSISWASFQSVLCVSFSKSCKTWVNLHMLFFRIIRAFSFSRLANCTARSSYRSRLSRSGTL